MGDVPKDDNKDQQKVDEKTLKTPNPSAIPYRWGWVPHQGAPQPNPFYVPTQHHYFNYGALPSSNYIYPPGYVAHQSTPGAATAPLSGGVPPWKLPQTALPVRPSIRKSPFSSIASQKTMPIPATEAAKAYSQAFPADKAPIPKAPLVEKHPNVAKASSIENPSNLPKSGSNEAGRWPPSLRMYVERCFANCHTDADRDRMEGTLRTRIQSAIKEDTLYTTDWGKEPLLEQKLTSSASSSMNPPPGLSSIDGLTIGAKRAARAKRFDPSSSKDAEAEEEKNKNTRKAALLALAEEGIDWDEYSIIGTCQKLEKKYLRLTSAPDPGTVRPLPILKQTLEWLKRRWKENGDYNYVQRIRNEFTVQVYEIHARIALEQGDLGEYNQCQAQLKLLYESGIEGCASEFMAYRLLYLLHTKNRQEMNSLLTELTDAQRQHPAIDHALQVRKALALSNYCRLFKLYQMAPNMGGYLMDFFLARERVAALTTICKAYRPSVETSFLAETLAFDSIEGCRLWLEEMPGIQWATSSISIDTKATMQFLLNS